MEEMSRASASTAIGESTLSEIEAGTAEAVSYNIETHGVAGHGLGPPHLYVLGGFADSLKEQMQVKAQGDAAANDMETKMTPLVDYLEKASIEEKGRFCPFFKLTKCYKKKGETQKTRLTMAFGPSRDAQEARLLLMKIMSTYSLVDFKVGRPPAGGLERKVQQWLETFLA